MQPGRLGNALRLCIPALVAVTDPAASVLAAVSPINLKTKGAFYMDIKKELTKGSSALLVLSVLEKEDLYGYMIIKRIAEKSGNVFMFKEGTLYPILHGFESSGYVKSYWTEGETRKRKYYKITDKGRKALVKASAEWDTYSDAVNRVVKDSTAQSVI